MERIDGIKKVSPLYAIGWAEKDAMECCILNDLRSPEYDEVKRGGCWFCHNQGIDQLRRLYKDYPDLWKLFLKWDSDSPVTFKSDGHTVHDFDRRFKAEESGTLDTSKPFRWQYLEEQNDIQLTLFNCDCCMKNE